MLQTNNNQKPNILPIFYDLGERIRNTWARYDYTEDVLAEVAAEELSKAKLHTQFSYDDILMLALSPDPSISAYQIDSPFGDLQLIPYRHARFFI